MKTYALRPAKSLVSHFPASEFRHYSFVFKAIDAYYDGWAIQVSTTKRWIGRETRLGIYTWRLIPLSYGMETTYRDTMISASELHTSTILFGMKNY